MQDTTLNEIFEKFDGAFAENTMRAYRSDFRHYQTWCEKNGTSSLPAHAELLARYVDELSLSHKSATIRRRINSLGTVFKLSKNADPSKAPEVVLALKRMHRRIGRQQAQATPLTRDVLDKLLAQCDDDIRGLRNRVLLQLGYETMRRRSELCNFRFEDIIKTSKRGPAIRLVRSKTDQEGASRLITISEETLSAIKAWKKVADISGAILRSIDRHGNVGNCLNPGSIGLILNSLYRRCENQEPEQLFSGHSFRVGAALDLLEAGASLELIMLRGGWRSSDNAMGYLRNWC
ncbi:tyrosine-type recombinase/integrase [Gammaproteobacteria bacterium]|nr:tyrosine-type recombinase/integrase [Gammaproteobacteria bacterium]